MIKGHFISDKQLQRFHQARFGGDKALLILRILCFLLPNLYTEYVTIQYHIGLTRLYYFTLISLTVVSFTAFLSVYISTKKVLGHQLSRKLLRTYQFLFQTAFVSQIIVFLVYWAAIHHTNANVEETEGKGYMHYLIVVHIIPFI